MSMSPQVLSRLECLSAAVASEGPVSRVNTFVKPDSRRIFEFLSTVSARTMIIITVSIQNVLL
jgi:hypothetical protein